LPHDIEDRLRLELPAAPNLNYIIVSGQPTTLPAAHYWKPDGNKIACMTTEYNLYTMEIMIDFRWIPEAAVFAKEVLERFVPDPKARVVGWYARRRAGRTYRIER